MLTVSRLANVGARQIFDGFRTYRRKFSAITRRASKRFEAGDPAGLQRDTSKRIDLYDEHIYAVVAGLRELLGNRLEERSVWMSMKAVYSGLLTNRGDWDLAETFYNSVTRRIFTTVGVDQDIEFANTDFDEPPTQPDKPVFQVFENGGSTAALIEHLLAGLRLDVTWKSAAEDARRVQEVLEARLGAEETIQRAEVVTELFFRADGAYLIGRLECGDVWVPFALALSVDEQGVFVDAVMLDENDISILFSFTRSYFLVETRRPYDLVHFLKTILPSKRIAELYISMGHNRHGKTELYRDLFRRLRENDEDFDIAPGQLGMVMIAFTLPTYDLVFKVIRDTFPAQKRASRSDVARRYRLVFEHDRAGRLVDTQKFEYLELDLDRFSNRLLDELRDDATIDVEITDTHVVLRSVYVQRRVRPLDLYVREADPEAAAAAVVDFGAAIKDLARANVFPGDIFLKNFGVTRHGRVVFYDYDELTLLTECNFRRMPEPTSYEDALSAKPWFSVGEDDVFPEEFLTFLGVPKALERALLGAHPDLFQPDFWRDTQARINSGEIARAVPHGRYRLTERPGQLPLF